jgi:hypothetical protein
MRYTFRCVAVCVCKQKVYDEVMPNYTLGPYLPLISSHLQDVLPLQPISRGSPSRDGDLMHKVLTSRPVGTSGSLHFLGAFSTCLLRNTQRARDRVQTKVASELW